MPTQRARRYRIPLHRVRSLAIQVVWVFVAAPSSGADTHLDNQRLLNNLLLGQRVTDHTGCYVEGWLDQGFTWNPDRPVDRFNGPVLQNDRANEYQLNQLYLIAARAADTESESLSFGFRADVLYGTDAYFFHSLGLDDNIISDSSSRFYKLALPQLHAEVFAPIGRGVTFQIGKWYTPVGYETGLATEDFFYSKPMNFLPIAYSHTGILAAFDLTAQISMSHGLHRGTDTWEDNNNNLGYTGAVTWTSRDEATTLTYAINIGPEQDERADWLDIDGMPGPDAPGENLDRIVYAVTLETQLTENVLYVIDHVLYFQEGSETYGFEDAEAYGITQYLLYDFNDQFAAGFRLEVFRDDDGSVVSGFRSQNASAPGVYTNLTCGLQCRPRECLLIRPELRLDWQDRDNDADTPAFNAGTCSNQLLFSTDVVVCF